MSRTFHFGRKGANVNNDGYYLLFFHTHVVNKMPNVRLRDLDRLEKVHTASKATHCVHGSNLDGTLITLQKAYDEELDDLFRRATRARAVAPGTVPGELPNAEKCGFTVPDNTAAFDLNNPMGMSGVSGVPRRASA